MKIPSLFVPALLTAVVQLSAASPNPLPDDPSSTSEDRVFMQKAYALAAQAVEKGNAPFGALLVVDGKIVAECGNNVATSHDLTQHAELGLISACAPTVSGEDLHRGTLYASSEPCIMCCGAILNAGVARVVYGTTEAQFQKFIHPIADKNPLTFREVVRRTNPGVKVSGPLMESEGLAQHAAYWPEAMKKWQQQ